MKNKKQSAIRLREIADIVEKTGRICPGDFILPWKGEYEFESRVAYSIAVDDAIETVCLAGVLEYIVQELTGQCSPPYTEALNIKHSLWELRRNIRNNVTTDFGWQEYAEQWHMHFVKNIRYAAELMEKTDVLKEYAEILKRSGAEDEKIFSQLKRYRGQLSDRE